MWRVNAVFSHIFWVVLTDATLPVSIHRYENGRVSGGHGRRYRNVDFEVHKFLLDLQKYGY